MLSDTEETAPIALQFVKPRNVLHVVAGMDPKTGGVCQAIRTIIGGLADFSVHNEVASLDAPEADYLADSPFPIHALGPTSSSWHYSNRLLPWLRENMTRFDAVIIHGLWLYHSYAARKAMEQLQRNPALSSGLPKFLVMPHGMLDPWFQRASGRKIKAVRNWLYWKLIEKNVVNEADGVLFTCEEELLLARQPFQPYTPDREINVGHGIASSPAFLPAMEVAFQAACPELDNQPYLLFLSRIDVKKGVDLLVEAYRRINYLNQGKDIQLPRLVIAGPGINTPYGQRIKQLVDSDPAIRQSILFPGMLTGAAKWGAFYGCEAFVLPSHQENFGIAVVEALSCGKPVLISDQVNIWREIEAAGAGLVGPVSVAGTQQLMEQFLALTPAERSALRRQSRWAFENHFSINPAAVRMVEAIGV